MAVIKRLLMSFINHRDPAFYTGTINMVVMFLLSMLKNKWPDVDFSAFGVNLSQMLVILLGVALGHSIGNAASASAPSTPLEAQAKTELAEVKAEALQTKAAKIARRKA